MVGASTGVMAALLLSGFVLVLVGLRRLDWLVATAFVLLGVVLVEPAPPDLLLALALGTGLVTGRLLISHVPPLVLILLGGFAATNVFAVSAAIDQRLSMHFALVTVFLLCVAAFMPMYVTNARVARLLVRCYLLGAVPAALLAALAMFMTFPFSEWLLGLEGARAQGLFKDPNVFGPFLVPPAMIVLEELFRPRLLTSSRAVKVAMLIALIAGVLLSYSRAAWINATVAMAVMLVVLFLRGRDGGRRLVIGLVTMLALLLAAVAIVVLTSSSDFFAERAQVQSYDSERFSTQARGLQYAAEQPLTGIGPGQFEIISPVSAHSLYVRAAAETGVTGFAMLACVLALTLGMAVHQTLTGRDSQGIGAAPLLASWCGLLVNSAVVDTIHWRHFWVVAGLIYVGAAVRAPDSLPGARHHRSTPVLLPM